MHATFVHLFVNMRKIGSTFWLRKWALSSSLQLRLYPVLS